MTLLIGCRLPGTKTELRVNAAHGIHSAMSLETIEREVAVLKLRLEQVEAKIQPHPGQRWRAAVGSIKPNDLTRAAARLGAEWRAEENARR